MFSAYRLRQVLCGLHGHNVLLHLERDRVSLRCATCEYETPGWALRPRTTASSARLAARARHENMVTTAVGGRAHARAALREFSLR